MPRQSNPVTYKMFLTKQKPLRAAPQGYRDLESAETCTAAQGCHFEHFLRKKKKCYTLLQQLPRHLQSVKWGKYCKGTSFRQICKGLLFGLDRLSRVDLPSKWHFVLHGTGRPSVTEQPGFDTRHCYSIILPSIQPEKSWAQRYMKKRDNFIN
jgi:hypothetical protein